MLKLLILAAIVVTACADEAQVEIDDSLESDTAASGARIIIDGDDRGRQFSDGLELNRYREERARHRIQDRGHDDYLARLNRHPDEDSHLPGPVILRTINPHSHGQPDIERQNKIIADVYSPDYVQPTWILDYRYLKTGGRDYTRTPGGQIVILPRNVKAREPKDFPDYDSLIEHLRLRRIEERKQREQEAYRHQQQWENPHQH